jgi:hypothetical protein
MYTASFTANLPTKRPKEKRRNQYSSLFSTQRETPLTLHEVQPLRLYISQDRQRQQQP